MRAHIKATLYSCFPKGLLERKGRHKVKGFISDIAYENICFVHRGTARLIKTFLGPLSLQMVEQ